MHVGAGVFSSDSEDYNDVGSIENPLLHRQQAMSCCTDSNSSEDYNDIGDEQAGVALVDADPQAPSALARSNLRGTIRIHDLIAIGS